VKLLTFNIRYPEPADGANAWEHRREAVAATIRQSMAAVVGLQEPVLDQLLYLDVALPEYRRFGISRYGNDFEKFTAILYQPEQVTLLAQGAFWLSQTPDVPASMSWLIHKPYAVNWGHFQHTESGQRFHVYNTHFPYKPEQAEARIESAQLLARRAIGERVFLLGDFNSPDDSEVHRILTETFLDSWTGGPEGTFHGFTGTPSRHRLDWILCQGSIIVESCLAITAPVAGRYPSDHFPVLGSFEF